MKDYRAALVTARVNYYPICAFLTAFSEYHDIWLNWFDPKSLKFNHEGVLEVWGHDHGMSWLIQMIQIDNYDILYYYDSNISWYVRIYHVIIILYYDNSKASKVCGPEVIGVDSLYEDFGCIGMQNLGDITCRELTGGESGRESILLLKNLLLESTWIWFRAFIICSLTSLQNNAEVSCKLLNLGCKMQANMLHLRRAIGTQALAMALLSCTQGAVQGLPFAFDQ